MRAKYQPLAVLLSIIAVLLLSGMLVFNNLRDAIHSMVDENLAAIALLKSQQIEQLLDDRHSDARSLGVDSFFARGVGEWYAGGRGDTRQRALIRGQLQGFIEAHHFGAAVLLDRHGRAVLKAGERAPEIGHVREQIMRVMSGGKTDFIDLHRHDAELYLMGFIAPLQVDGKVIGAIYLMEDAERLLFPLLLPEGGDKAPLETHLVRRQGERVLFLSPLRGLADAPLSLSLTISDALVSAQAALGKNGLLSDGHDYRGEAVLAFATPIKQTDWSLVASVPEGEAYALVERVKLLAIATMLFLLLSTVAWFMQWQRRQHAAHAARQMQTRLAGEQRFRAVFENASFAMARHALNGEIMEVNDVWCSLFGYTRNELAVQQPGWQQLTHPGDLEQSAQLVRKLLAGEIVGTHLEKRYLRKDGSEFWAGVQVSLVYDEQGAPDFFIVATQDISGRKQLEEERSRNLTLLQMALDAAQEAVWEWDLLTGQTRFSPEYYTMLGYLPDEFPANQQEWLARIHPEDRDGVWRKVQDELLQHQDLYIAEYRMLTKDGRYRWIQGRGRSTAQDASGKATRLVGINIDIHERKQTELQASYLAYHDKLTGLPNRALFFDRFSQTISRAKRDQRRVALLFADLDGFKQVNDSLGHEAGDAVLRMAAQRLLACVRAVDTVVRFGGDEFAVILGDLDEPSQAAQVAEKIVAAFAAGMTLEGGLPCHVGVSIGISLFPENGSTMDGLLTAADQAMYDSKHAGKNTYTFFGEQIAPTDEQWIRFDQSHLIGIAELDEQHRNLARMVNRLNSEWRKGAAHAELLSLFDELVTATAEHFETEGGYMAHYAYPEQRRHEKEHALLVDEAVRLRNGLSDGGELLALQTIKDWLINHILHADSQLARFLVEQGVR
jgi:diguanylate cyclase (GGDEF)-like protein/PAS domain S-box-containing protein/hemerythrin-like metal-binding protein